MVSCLLFLIGRNLFLKRTPNRVYGSMLNMEFGRNSEHEKLMFRVNATEIVLIKWKMSFVYFCCMLCTWSLITQYLRNRTIFHVIFYRRHLPLDPYRQHVNAKLQEYQHTTLCKSNITNLLFEIIIIFLNTLCPIRQLRF